MAIWNQAKLGAATHGIGDHGATSPEWDRLHLVALTGAGGVTHTSWDKVSWEAPANLGGQLHAQPTIVAVKGTNKLEVLGVGLDDRLWRNSGTITPGTNKAVFTGWGSKPVAPEKIRGPVAAVSRDTGLLDLFAGGADNDDVLHLAGGEHGWSPNWESLGGKIVGRPTALAWDRDRLDVFCLGTDNCLYHRWWGGQWLPLERKWQRLCDQPVQHLVAAVSWAPGRIDVFALQADKSDFLQLVHLYWQDKGPWHPNDASGRVVWEPLGHPPNVSFLDVPGTLSAVARSGQRLDVFAIGATAAAPTKTWIFRKQWSPGWSTWTDLEGEVGENCAVTLGEEVAVVAEGQDDWAGSIRYTTLA